MRRTGKRITTLAPMGLVATLVMTGYGRAADGKRVVRIFLGQSETHPQYIELVAFRDHVEEQLGDKFEIQILPNEILGSAQKAIKLTQMGAIDFTMAGIANLEIFADVYEVLSMPYFFDSKESHLEVMQDANYIEQIYKSTDEAGFWVLIRCNAGARNSYTKKSIRTPEDLKGLEIRAQQSPASVRMMQASGIAASPMSSGEVYMTARQGVIDGTEGNELVLTNNKHGEVAKYSTYNMHQMVPDMLVRNLKFLNSLSPEELQTFKKTAALSAEVGLEEQNKQMEETKAMTGDEMGVEFTEVNVAPLKERVFSLHEEMLRNNPVIVDVYNYIQAINRYVEEEWQTQVAKSLRDGMNKALGAVNVALFGPVMVVGTYQILIRYLFSKPSTVSEELLTCALTRIPLLVAAWVFGKREHMRMGFLADESDEEKKRMLDTVTEGVIMVFATIVPVYGGTQITALTMPQKTVSLGTPIRYVYAMVPVCGVLMLTCGVLGLADLVVGKNEQESEGMTSRALENRNRGAGRQAMK